MKVLVAQGPQGQILGVFADHRAASAKAPTAQMVTEHEVQESAPKPGNALRGFMEVGGQQGAPEPERKDLPPRTRVG
jgi:hypothetical protein